jgi:hypothetical protein
VCGATIDYDDGNHTHACDHGVHEPHPVNSAKHHLHHCGCNHTWFHSAGSEEWGQLI